MGPAWRVFVLLWAVYLLTYGGGPHAVDEIGQLGATASLVKRGSFATNELFWTIAAAGDRADAQVEVGPGGDVWSKRGPAVPVAMAPWYALAMAIPWLDLVFTALLAMSLVTAATGGMLTALGLRFGLSESGGIAAGLLYGLTGLAWPYARLGFGEPLIAFAVVLAALAGRRGLMGAALAGGCVALAAGTKWSAGLLGLPVGLYVVWACSAGRFGSRPHPDPLPEGEGTWQGRLLAFGVAGALGLGLLGWYNLLHFGSPLTTGYGVEPREGFTAPPLEGLFGLTLSPYRGIVWFAPTVVVGAVLLRIAARRAPGVSWLAGGVAAATLLTYVAWWTWWGGFTWGPRFLLPACPLLCLAVPLAWERLGRVARGLVGGLIGLSALVQLPGVLIDFNPFERALRAEGFSVGASPIAGHLRRVAAEGVCALDVAWLRCGHFDLILALLLGAGLAAGLFALWRPGRAAEVVGMACLTIGLAALLVRGPQPPGPAEQALLAAAVARDAGARPGDATIALASPETPALWSHDRWRGEVYGLNHDDVPRLPEAERMLQRASTAHPRLWLLASNVAPDNGVERWLRDRTFLESERSFVSARLVGLVTGAGMLAGGAPVASFASGMATLETARVLVDPPRVQLLWRAPASTDLKVFVHLYRGGQLVGQIDAPLRERMNYVLPPPGGEASVEVGLYRPDGQRLSTAFPQNRVPVGLVR